MLQIRPTTEADQDAIWAILEPVIRAGDTYTLDPGLSRQDALAYWLSPDKSSFVAEDSGEILGTYYIRANQTGGGKHVCNCGYMTAPAARGRGIAHAMCEHSLELAPTLGFRAMQFNFVVSKNEGAVRLWQKLGFAITGTLPGAFHHPTEGFIDAYVMYRSFTETV